tara:strand:- start:339 stop:554 length:216 start_codon:yes stop_codon:yes gene_type:complete
MKVKQGLMVGAVLLVWAWAIWFTTRPEIRIHNMAVELAPVMYLDTLEQSYIYKTKALRIYMPIAIKCNEEK